MFGPARTGSFDLLLPPQPASVAQARRRVRDLLAPLGDEALADAAAVVVSELVTNALLHAGTPIRLVGRLDGRHRLRLEVHDGGPHLPVTRHYASTAGTGRGLRLVAELCEDWGVEQQAAGKAVWCVLSDGTAAASADESGSRRRGGPEAPPEGSAPGGAARTAAAQDRVTIRLRRMPLLLHDAWREHAETLLREALLASLDDEGPDGDPIMVHAAATDAVSLLEEQVPSVPVDLEPDRLMAGATEPLATAEEIRLEVPDESVPHFTTLERALDRALRLAGEGRVLTPVTQPEIEAFRRWVCDQVRTQAAGGVPTPWSLTDDGLELSRPAPAWDAGAVRVATEALIVADDANRILAVSPATLDLLGYDDASELEGQRLVTVIPERLRQAHVAGFTLHLLVGRSPLLDGPVVVPALRRDGSETMVRMVVSAERTADDRTVFVAELSAAG